ncbi:MAG: type II toxin-antitoxin system RelE/ParE family toxin [Geminicoccaceae bacterium]
MPAPTYTIHAVRELRAIRLWITLASGDERADAMLEIIVAAAKLLAERPLLGRERPEIASGLRSFPVPPYVLFYRPGAEGCRIMRVIHGHQELGRAFGQPRKNEP